MNRSLGRKAAAIGAAAAATAAGLVFLNPSAAQAASCVKASSFTGGVEVTNTCGYLVDLRIHWSNGAESSCTWIGRNQTIDFVGPRGASYSYWIDCKGQS